MNKIILTNAARQDLRDIKEYISNELNNPAAATKIVSNITKHLHGLERYAKLGRVLTSKQGNPLNYRILVCGNYLAFYRIVDETHIHIDRILHGQRDYLTMLFGGIQEDEASEE